MIDIKITGLQEAIDKVTSLKKSLPQMMDEVVERLMNEGYNVASVGFSEALYAGTNDVKVALPVWEGDLLVLRANGESVAFIEFGTGVLYPQYPILPTGEDAYANLVMSGRGEYGKKHGSNPPWYYPIDKGLGEMGRPKIEKDGSESTKWAYTIGNPPARAMYQATVTVADKEKAIKIATEVFNR